MPFDEAVVGIVNEALVQLGQKRLVSLDQADEEAGPDTAKLMKALYPTTRDEVLAEHPWNFAIRRATLALLGAAPVYGPAKAYALPDDSLRVIDTNLDRTWGGAVWFWGWNEWWPSPSWQIEGRTLVTDDADVKVRYVARVEDPTGYSPGFRGALVYALASKAALPLTESVERVQAMEEKYDRARRMAKAADGQEGSPRVALCTALTTDCR